MVDGHGTDSQFADLEDEITKPLNKGDRLCAWPHVPQQTFNVWNREDPTCLDAPLKPARIAHYAVSANGSYVATLSYTGRHMHVDLWTISVPTSSLDLTCPNTCPTAHTTLPKPTKRITLRHLDLYLSVSWDGSQISLCSTEKEKGNEYFRLFGFDCFTSVGDVTTTRKLTPSNRHEQCQQILSFSGYAKFFSTAAEAPCDENERFITCDGRIVAVYSTKGAWAQIYSILISEKRFLLEAKDLVYHARGQWFMYLRDDQVAVIHVNSGSLVSHAPLGHKYYSTKNEDEGEDEDSWFQQGFSGDGSMRAIGYFVFSTESGQLLGRTTPIASIRQLINRMDRDVILTEDCRLGVQNILNPTDFSRADPIPKILNHVIKTPQRYRAHYTSSHGSTLLTMSHGSKLDIHLLDDIISQAAAPNCNAECSQNHKKLDETYETWEVSVYKPGMTLRLKHDFYNMFGDTVTVDMEDPESRPRNVLTFICDVIYGEPGDRRLFFLENQSQFISIYYGLITIWGLPESSDEECELLLAWRLKKNKRHYDQLSLTACDHGNHLSINIKDDSIDFGASMKTKSIPCTVSRAFHKDNASYFLDALQDLAEQYANPKVDGTHKSAIVRYLMRNINRYHSSDGDSSSIMSFLCNQDFSNEVYLGLLKGLLESSYIRWVPQIKYAQGSNPVGILLEKSRTKPEVMEPLKVIIDYCSNRAKESKSTAYLLFILECMPELESLNPDLALKVARRFAYLPVLDKQYIINNHAIISPPTLPRFWVPAEQELYQCKNPILQFHYTTKKPAKRNQYFTEDVFVAPVCLLWSIEKPPDGTQDQFIEINPISRDTWWRTAYHLMRLQFNFKSDIHVIRPRYYGLDILDNPAVEAVIQYKWYTFGYALWLVRFFAQCCYYLLILIAAFVQVYSEDPDSLLGVFITIIVLSLWFLWLEALQIRESFIEQQRKSLQDPGHPNATLDHLPSEDDNYYLSDDEDYISSNDSSSDKPQRWKVMKTILRKTPKVAFNLTGFMGNSKTHSKNDDDKVAELRVSQQNFFGAVTAVYFIMGGRYDPIADEIEEDIGWPLHVMVMIYFFFTVILMLNVLIALINLGFDKADGTWRLIWLENRLRYVERAENMTYHVPGFRQSHKWFPKEIYYTATDDQVKKYSKRMEDEDKNAGRVLYQEPTVAEDNHEDRKNKSEDSPQDKDILTREEFIKKISKVEFYLSAHMRALSQELQSRISNDAESIDVDSDDMDTGDVDTDDAGSDDADTDGVDFDDMGSSDMDSDGVDSDDVGSDKVEPGAVDSEYRIGQERQQDGEDGAEKSNSRLKNGIVDVSSEASLPRDENTDDSVAMDRSVAGNIALEMKNQMKQLVVEQKRFQNRQLRREQIMGRRVAHMQQTVELLVKKLAKGDNDT
ncbi:hypothetical protein BGZ51_004015 [Haplosporangium sp. Z 767]|nr:hypothetical protein BGZ51_004015 [Haplosporangium sp. Z 767]